MIYTYCDESCHLGNDGNDIMVLGALTCPESSKQKIFDQIRAIKEKHGMSTWVEMKWTKVSGNKLKFYQDVIDYFFDNRLLNFRAVVATGKRNLNHHQFNNDHDLWYYKMYFLLLRPITYPDDTYRIFLDIKDTRGGMKTKKLHEVLCNNIYDFNKTVIRDIKQVHSNESELLQICDLLIGALSFFHRGLYYTDEGSSAKKEIIDTIVKRTGSDLTESTPKSENKFNLFIWQPRGNY